MIINSLVVTDPVGTNKGLDTVLFRNDYPEDVSDNELRCALNNIVCQYIQIVQAKGWGVTVIDNANYEWRKRIEAIDELGRLRAVRDFAIVAAWEGEI